MIALSELGFKYGKRSSVFTGLNLDIPAGRSVGVLGANGVGKTTLVKLLGGLISPTEGQVDVMGFVPRERKTALFENLFIVPEESELPAMKGEAYMAQFSAFYPAFDHSRFRELASQFSVDTHKRLTEMSLGQKKKFLIAFALSTGCRLILMDEPTNGLDIPSKGQFRDMVIKHQTDEQTFLICTHQVRDLDSIIDSVVMMNEHHAHWFDLSVLPESISQVTNPEQSANVLYAEQRMGANVAVVLGGQSHATDIDLEMLFNTFHNNYEGLVSAISEGESE